MSFGERLKEARTLRGLTQKQLAEKLNIGSTTVTGYEKDNSEPNMLTISKIMEILEVDANFLFQDETRELYENEASPEEFENIIKKYRLIAEYSPDGAVVVDTVLDREYAIAEKLRERKEQIQKMDAEISSEIVPYPYLGKIACAGTGFYFDDIPTEIIKAPYMDGADFIIGVSGESMEPDYHNGEKLYVRKVEYLRNGDVGIFTIGNECFLKELGEGGLISRNKDYNDIPGDEKVRLIGKVIGKVED